MKKILTVILIILLLLCASSILFAGGKQEVKEDQNLPIMTKSMGDLIVKAKEEGVLVSYGLPDDWVNYGAIRGILEKKYGLETMDTDMGSGTIISTLKLEKTNAVADITDLGYNFATVINTEKLSQPYKNQYWDEIPDFAKDPDGLWSAAYWGTIAFTVNTDIVKNLPKTWNDLLKPEYRNMVSIKDPRESGTANMMVLAAAYANGGDVNNIQPGIDYFVKLQKAGNINSVRPGTSAIQKGEAPISIFWDFDGLSKKYALGMDSLKIVVPSDGTVAGMYIQFITSGAPNPYAARLMIETEYSDEGQIEYAKGFVHPIRKSVKLPEELKAKFPPEEDYKSVNFVKDATLLGEAAKLIAEGWDAVAVIQ